MVTGNQFDLSMNFIILITFDFLSGKFDFEAMCTASPILGPLSFFVFVLVASIVLINIFLTLIISAFETVKHDIMKQNNEYEIMDFMMRKVKSLFGFANINEMASKTLDDQRINTIEDELNVFPEKVDRLLYYINDMYFDGQLDVNNKGSPRKPNFMPPKSKVTPSLRQASKRRGRPKMTPSNVTRQNTQPKITILDWMEVEDDTK